MTLKWIKMREGLELDPKTIAIANRLRISIDAVIGKLFRLWCWANRYAQRDAVQHINGLWVDSFLSQSGFAEAMVVVGWLRITETGVEFINFREHNWQEEHQKGLAAERQRRYRERKDSALRSQSRNDDVTSRRDTVTLYPDPNPYPNKKNKFPSETTTEPEETGSRGNAPPPDVVLTIPCLPGKKSGPKEWHLTAAKVAEYAESFPGIDVLCECKKARQWCIDNAAKRKTWAGMPAFLARWLTSAQNRGGPGPAGRTPAPPTPPLQDRIRAAFERRKGGDA